MAFESSFPDHNAAGFLYAISLKSLGWNDAVRMVFSGLRFRCPLDRNVPVFFANTFTRGLVNVGDLPLATNRSETVAACSCHKVLSPYFTITPVRTREADPNCSLLLAESSDVNNAIAPSENAAFVLHKYYRAVEARTHTLPSDHVGAAICVCHQSSRTTKR